MADLARYITPTQLFPLAVLAAIFCFVGYYWYVQVPRSGTLEWIALRERNERPFTFTLPFHRLERKDALPMLLLTVLYAFTAFFSLGSLSAPQSALNLGSGESVTWEFQEEMYVSKLWYYSGLGTGEYNVEISSDGSHWSTRWQRTDEEGEVTGYYWADAEGYSPSYAMTQDYADLFKWLEVEPENPQYVRYLRITGKADRNQLLELAELVLFDEDGQPIPIGDSTNPLFDEADTVPDSPSWYNSSYFDEIYHPRTAYEHLHGMPVYETTHPPLGKVFIMLGVALFGMTGFGWRVAGAAFGVAMVPVLYLLVRRLCRKPAFALFAAALAVFDTLRFAQSRIATIDVYGTFFILLAAYFMVWYCQSVLEKGVERSVLPMALAGLAFGLGTASKWTGLYAGAGLAVLYFGVLWRRARQKPPRLKQEIATALCGGVVFFVALPLIVYFASYIPYFWREGGFSLAEWWQCQVSMYRYHSTLVATHPYESRWYTWPFSARPVWYYLASGLPEGLRGTIAALGNLPVWLAALAGLGWAFWRQLSGRGNGAAGAVTVLFLTQFLPWVLVSRCTFLYHYFPSLWFAVAALALAAANLYERRPALARRLCIGIAAAGVFFVCYYPVISGLPVAEPYVNALRILPSWMF